MNDDIVCSICGSPAEYIEKEGCWRHKGQPWDDGYLGQQFCDRYGYPIHPKVLSESTVQ